MGLRKLLNIKTKKERDIIDDDIKIILSNCNIIAINEWNEQKENQIIHDGQCPKCKRKNVVDKIVNVNGNGKISGDFKLKFGGVSGSLNISTDEVNHCTICGNQWYKFKTKVITKTNILRVALNYLGDINNNPEKNKKSYWKFEAIKVFENSHAESIKTLIKKQKKYLRFTTINVLTIKKLRENYKSIFD